MFRRLLFYIFRSIFAEKKKAFKIYKAEDIIIVSQLCHSSKEEIDPETWNAL